MIRMKIPKSKRHMYNKFIMASRIPCYINSSIFLRPIVLVIHDVYHFGPCCPHPTPAN